jgi:hypothetical protein
MNLPTPSGMFQDLTVTRATAKDTYDAAGELSTGATSSVTVRGSVTPATPNDMKRLDDAFHTSAGMRIIASTELRTGNDSTGFAADLVTLGGELWEVANVKAWPSYAPGQQHWDAVAVRLDREGPA